MSSSDLEFFELDFVHDPIEISLKISIYNFRACSPRTEDFTPPHTPPNNKMVDMPTFNVITATPTPSLGRLSPDRESVINNNNIIISDVVVEDCSSVKLQKPSDNFEETCPKTCPEKPNLI